MVVIKNKPGNKWVEKSGEAGVRGTECGSMEGQERRITCYRDSASTMPVAIDCDTPASYP